MITNEVIFFMIIIVLFRESRVGTPIVDCFASRDTDYCFVSGVASRDADCLGIPVSGVETLIMLISGAVAAGVVAAAPEGLSLFGAFLDYALEHRFATFGAEWCLG